MDKLKPIINQKFWVFLGLALIFPFVGWYLASNDFATGVDARELEIKGSFDSVQLSGDIVNDKWVAGATEIVKEQEGLLQQSQRQLWLAQSANMDWPPNVSQFMQKVPYESLDIPARAREFYSKEYHPQLTKMEQRLQPFNYLTGEGSLLFDGYQTGSSYPHVPVTQWINQPPTPEEMWNAQIDFWLVRAVFESIISINQGTKITEAPVRQLLELQLRGGVRDYTAGSASTGSEMGSMPESEGLNMDVSPSSSGSAGGASIKTKVEFDLSEELGPDGSGGSGSFAPGSMEDMFSGSSADSDSPTATTQKGPIRYVDDDENSPFRTRAFVLGVVMDQKVLPEFLAELSRSDWPIQIIRVQTETYNPEQLSLSNTRPGRPGMGGMRPGGSRFSGSSTFDSSNDLGESGYETSGSTNPFSSSGRSTGRGPRTSMSRPAGGAGQANASGLVQQAMSDPYLAEVWIGGLITLFRPVEEVESTNAENGSPPNGNSENQINENSAPDSAGTQPDPAAGDDSTTTVPGDDSTEPGTEPPPETDSTETGTDDTLPTESPPDTTGTSN